MVTVTTILPDVRDVGAVINHSKALPWLSILSFQGFVPQYLAGHSCYTVLVTELVPIIFTQTALQSLMLPFLLLIASHAVSHVSH